MKEQKLKLWMGIGVATLLASSGVAADQDDEHHGEMMKSGTHGGEGGEHHEGMTGERHGGEGGEHSDHMGSMHHGGEGGEGHGSQPGPAFSYFSGGGEGGEGGESGDSGSPALSDGAYVAMIQMMQGHLMAARELIKAGEVADGRPHLTHPWIEVYPMVGSAPKLQGSKDLGEKLKALAEKAGEVNAWSDVDRAFQAAWKATEDSVNTLEGNRSQTAATVSKVVLALTKQAVLEYDEALDDGHFVAKHEYQDGWGFVLAAREYLDNHQKIMKKQNREAWRDAEKALERLQQAWPEAEPPASPVAAVSDLYANQARLELALAPYLY